jgi:NAD(P)-dependent dehydrogenase (short-subunit alcohol dehydrogenase family)
MGTRLKDRVAIVTGGGSGIGRAIATVFAGEGANVVIASRSLANLEDAVSEIKSKGRTAKAIVTDVTSENDVKNLVKQTVMDYGKVDILVNDSAFMAGTERYEIKDMNLAFWNKMFATNMTGTMLCTREVLQNMIARKRGCIINISSIAGVASAGGNSAYSSSKWAIIGFTQSLAIEVGKYNIRANSISPAGTTTNKFIENVKNRAAKLGISYEEALKKTARPYSLGRLNEPSEVGTAALFLASDDASAVTGQNLVVGSGFHWTHPGEID